LEGAGKGGVVPPAEQRFKPGESGNPNGRKAIGASVRDWMNILDDAGEDELRRLVKDKRTPASKRGAALRLIRSGHLRSSR
jgi:hypothetical protein